MKLNKITNIGKLRIMEILLDDNRTELTPRHAVTSTNLNHSEQPDYKTSFLEVLIWDLEKLKTAKGYQDFVAKAKRMIGRNPDKYPVITPKGIKSHKLTESEFKLLCKIQKDVGLKKIRLFFRYNLHKDIKKLTEWAIAEYGNDIEYVLDFNMDFINFKKLYLEALEKKHCIVHFISRDPNKNNLEKFHFIQDRHDDQIIRWIFALDKKTKSGAVKPTFYFVLGYDITSFNTRRGTYQIPQSQLEVIKGFVYVLATLCYNEKCVILQNKTLGQSIREYARNKKDSVPCSAFSIVELNSDYDKFHKLKNPQSILQAVQRDLNDFNALV